MRSNGVQVRGSGVPSALRHGMTGRTILVEGEDPAEFEALREGMLSELGPCGALESEFAERAVACAWRLRRIAVLEAEAFEELARQADVKNSREAQEAMELEGYGYPIRKWSLFDDPPARSEELENVVACRVQALKDGVGRSLGRGLAHERAAATFMLIRRYESSLERALFAALAQVERLQSARRRGERTVEAGRGTRDAGREASLPNDGGLVGRTRGQQPTANNQQRADGASEQSGRGTRDAGDCRMGEEPAAVGEDLDSHPHLNPPPQPQSKRQTTTERLQGRKLPPAEPPCADAVEASARASQSPQPAPDVPRLTSAVLARLPKALVEDLLKLGVKPCD
jgi:hypothetical protein